MILPSEIDVNHPPHVTVSKPHRMRLTKSYVGHTKNISVDEKTSLHSLPVTVPERTWFDMVAWIEKSWTTRGVSLELPDGSIYSANPLELAVAWADRLIGGNYPVVSKKRLQLAVSQARGMRGLNLAREALRLIDEATQCSGDSLIRVQLARNGLTPGPPITLVGNTRPRSVLYPISYPSAKIAIRYAQPLATEAHHFLTSTDYERVENWRTLSFSASDIHARGTVVERVIDCAAGVGHERSARSFSA